MANIGHRESANPNNGPSEFPDRRDDYEEAGDTKESDDCDS
jgi:hypothetical protein